ncbi:kelch repeat-containing protein [Marinobacter litoralis]|uniref:Kelch repeat-containing protein n=1 Tax=Marinobacter litoralis TaxID=187981 RepID=UPI0018EB4422|nr:kelch repeat-containing protein [Marinobacter litoralis]MBJ6137700.1 PQQ-dependent sugar dehydrogenase [Marinobacter litoralis]
MSFLSRVVPARSRLLTFFLFFVFSALSSSPLHAAPNILVSEYPDRSAPAPLAGAELHGVRYIFISPDTGIKRVEFHLDAAPPSGAFSVENVAPFDFNGTEADDSAKPYDTSSVNDGQHSIYATVRYNNGTSELLSSVFTINNAAPALAFSQSTVSFSAQEGSTTATSQAVSLQTSDSNPVSFTLSDNATWLSVAPSSGTTPQSINLTADPSGLPPGQYTAQVTANSNSASSDNVLVSLNVVPQSSNTYALMVSSAPDRSSAISLRGASLAGDVYVFVPQQPDMTQVRFYIDNTQKNGSPDQTENVAPYDLAGTASNDQAQAFDTTQLTDDTHTVTAVIKLNDGSTHEVTEFFDVTNNAVFMSFNPSSLAGSRHVDNPSPIVSNSTLSDSDNSDAPFSLTSSETWLSASADSGTTPATVTVTADPTGLPAGTYNAELSASASSYVSAVLNYTLTVTDGPQGLLAAPSSLTFNAAPDSTAASQTVSVSHTSNQSVAFTVSTNELWLSASPTNTNTPDNVAVSVDTTGMASGNYSGLVTLSPASGNPVDIPVQLTVASSDKCAPVQCSDVRIDLPYQLSFTEGQGYYMDKNGRGTGFTWVDKPTSGTGYIQDNLEMFFLQGYLELTTTSGLNIGGVNSLDNALAVGFAAPNQITRITTQVLDVPQGTGNYEQAGLWFGNDEDNYLKLVAASTPSGTVLHYLLEVNGQKLIEKNVAVAGLVGSDAKFGLIVDPYSRSIDLNYSLNGGSTYKLDTVYPPDEFFSFDAAGIDPEIGTRSFTGIFATHRHAAAPIIYRFNEFTLQEGEAPLAPNSGVDFIKRQYNIDYPTSMVWGPDDRLYVTQLFGTIRALTFDGELNVINDEVINALENDLGPRLTLGITVSPYSTANDVELWVAHSSPSIDNGEPNSGMVTRIGGQGFGTVEHVITGLPRAIANHSINSIHFGPDDNRLYIAMGGNTGAGAPNESNSEFGQMQEQPLSAAILVADVFSANFDGTCHNANDLFGPPPCDVTTYATGLRNSYDFVFHSNGNMYATDNGLGVTGTFPPKPEPQCLGLASTASYQNGGHNPGAQPDLLLLIKQGAYYGHPNPHRDECVFKDGSYQNVAPLPNYEEPAYLLGEHKSSNAIIEYQGGQGCVGDYLNGQLLITNYSVGDDIFRVKLDSTGNYGIEGSPLVTGFNDPLPMTKSPSGNLFVGEFGGGNLTSLKPVSLGCWEPKAPAPIAVLDASGATIDGKFYAVGGKNSSGHLNNLLIYDPASDSWSQGAPLPGAGVENPAVAAYNGELYVFGGSTAPFSGAVTNASVYNPLTNTWATLPSMPTARGGATAQALNGNLYIIGGMGTAGNSLNTVEVFDPLSNTWQPGQSLTYVRDNPGSAVMNGKIYVFGGRHREASGTTIEGAMKTVEMFDPATGNWSNMSPMPTGRRTMSVGVIGGKIQVAGGEFNANNTTGVFEQNEEFDPTTNTWRPLTNVPTPKHGAAAATINGTLYIMGGGATAGSSYTSSMEALRY